MRPRALYLGAYVEAFWLALALATIAVVGAREWTREDAMRLTELVSIAAMAGWMIGVVTWVMGA